MESAVSLRLDLRNGTGKEQKGEAKIAIKKSSVEHSRKEYMRGKGGPDNAFCTYKSVRQRTWGKWVAEIQEPNCGARVWLGTFNTSLAACAYDDVAKRLYESCAKLSLPDASPSTSNFTPGDFSVLDYYENMNENENSMLHM